MAAKSSPRPPSPCEGGAAWSARIGVVLALAVATAPTVASAQPDAPGQPAPSPQDVQKATTAFQTGTRLFQAKKYALALEQFQKSYDTVASPNSLLYMARCQAEISNLREAFKTFQRVIAEADARPEKYGPTRDSAKVEIEELANKISVLTVNVGNPKESTRLRVGGAIVPKEDWGKQLPLDPGPVEVSLETDGSPPVSESLTLAKGERKTLDVAVPEPKQDIAPPPPPPETESGGGGPSGLLIGGLVLAGVGVAGMVTFGVAGGLSLSTYGEVEDKCSAQPGGTCSSAADVETIDKGKQQQLIANIGAIIGGVGLAAGATLIIIDVATGGGSSGSASAEVGAVPVKVEIGPGYAGLRGRF